MLCSMPYGKHTDSNNDKPIAEGDRSTKSSAYMRWLINVVPIVQPTLLSFSLISDHPCRYRKYTEGEYLPDVLLC